MYFRIPQCNKFCLSVVFYSQPKYAYIELKTFWGRVKRVGLADTKKSREPAVLPFHSLLLVFPFGSVWKPGYSVVTKSSKGARVAFQVLAPEPDTFSVFVF